MKWGKAKFPLVATVTALILGFNIDYPIKTIAPAEPHSLQSLAPVSNNPIRQRPNKLDQSCTVHGTVYEAGKPAAGVKLALQDHVPALNLHERELDTTVTDSNGNYVFKTITQLTEGRAMYVWYRNTGQSQDAGRLWTYYGPDIATLDAEECTKGIGFDIGGVKLLGPKTMARVQWGEPFSWEPRELAPSMSKDAFQIRLTNTQVATQTHTLPETPITDSGYTPSASERPNDLQNFTKYTWRLSITQSGGIGLSLDEHSITFVSLTPPTPTATPAGPIPTITPSLTPPPDARRLCPDENFDDIFVVNLPPAPERADILLVFDATGSMEDTIEAAQKHAQAIMSGLATEIGDIQFGVAYFRDYHYPDNYNLVQPITGNRGLVESALKSFSYDPRPGINEERSESYALALHKATEVSSVGWRDNARRFLVLFGDDLPHDDNLNEGLNNPAMNPGQSYCGHGGKCMWDPGPDNIPGSPDDLDFQTVLQSVAAENITPLVLISGPWGSGWQDIVVDYWNKWANIVSPGGQAVAWDRQLPIDKAILDLIRRGPRVSRLEIDVYPNSYVGWLKITDPVRTEITEAAEAFDFTVWIPQNEPLGFTHTITLQAVADGIVVGEKRLILYLDPIRCPPPATAIPPGFRRVLLPATTAREFPKLYSGSDNNRSRVGPAAGYADTGIQVMNTDGSSTMYADILLFPQTSPYSRTDSYSPRPFHIDVDGVRQLGSDTRFLRELIGIGVPAQHFSATISEISGQSLAAIARTQWRDSLAAVLYNDVATSHELTIPIALRNFWHQTSILAIMADNNGRPVHGQIEFYELGSMILASTPVPFTLNPNEGLTYDLLDNHPAFHDLGDGFIGSARIRLLAPGGTLPDHEGRIGAVTFVNIATSPQAVWGYEAWPSGFFESQADSTLHIPLWRSRQRVIRARAIDVDASEVLTYSTGIAVANPNDTPVEVIATFYPATDALASVSDTCKMTKPFSLPAKTIEPRSNILFYQGDSEYPVNCYGSATISTTNPADTIVAVVNDAPVGNLMSAAYNAIPAIRAHNKIGLPLFRNTHQEQKFTTGVQVMNVGSGPADVSIQIRIGSEALLVPCPDDDCRVTIPRFHSYTWYPPGIASIPNNIVGSATIDSNQDIVAVVVDFPLAGGVDAAVYNGIPLFGTPEPVDP